MYKYKHFLDTFSATVCLPRSCQASEKTNYFIKINFFVEKIFYQNYSSSRKNNFFLNIIIVDVTVGGAQHEWGKNKTRPKSSGSRIIHAFFYKSKQKLNQAYFIIKKYCYENDLKIELPFFLLTTGTSVINYICCF